MIRNPETDEADAMPRRFRYLDAGGGASYDWAADHTFVKVGAADTGGAYTLMEDNLKAEFRLGLHLHRQHAETFYILEGAVDFHVDGEWIRAGQGASLHIPPGIPHGCTVVDRQPARFLMIFQPAGFDLFLAALGQMTEADFADAAKMTALEETHDIFQLGPLPERTP